MAEKPTYEELEQRIQELEQAEFRRKRAGEALPENVKRYKNIYDNAQIGLYRSRLRDGKMVMANHRMAEIFGYQHAKEFLVKYVALEPSEYQEMSDKLLGIIRDYGKITNFEAPVKKDDGSTIWLQISGTLSSEEGFYEGVAADITASKLAEQELSYSCL